MSKEFSHVTALLKEKTKLSHEEEAKMKDEVVSFMELHPVRVGDVQTSSRSAGDAMRDSRNIQAQNRKHPMMIATIIALFISGGTAFAAEGSLPGDTLYPVKIHVTEEVRGWAAFSDEAEARWEMRKAGRRMEEAKELEAEGRLTSEAKAEIEQSISMHAQSFSTEIKALREDGKEEEAKALRAEFVAEIHEQTGKSATTLSLDLDDVLEIEIGEVPERENSDEDDAQSKQGDRAGAANGTSSVSGRTEVEAGERASDIRGNTANWNFEGGTKIEGKVGGEVEVLDVIDIKTETETNADIRTELGL